MRAVSVRPSRNVTVATGCSTCRRSRRRAAPARTPAPGAAALRRGTPRRCAPSLRARRTPRPPRRCRGRRHAELRLFSTSCRPAGESSSVSARSISSTLTAIRLRGRWNRRTVTARERRRTARVRPGTPDCRPADWPPRSGRTARSHRRAPVERVGVRRVPLRHHPLGRFDSSGLDVLRHRIMTVQQLATHLAAVAHGALPFAQLLRAEPARRLASSASSRSLTSVTSSSESFSRRGSFGPSVDRNFGVLHRGGARRNAKVRLADETVPARPPGCLIPRHVGGRVAVGGRAGGLAGGRAVGRGVGGRAAGWAGAPRPT